MLTLRALVAKVRIEPQDLKMALLTIAKNGKWRPAVTESHRVLSSLAGADEKLATKLRGTLSSAPDGYGDIMFREKCVYYIFSSSTSDHFLEIGAVGHDVSDADLKELSDALETSIRASLDGRKTRHMNFQWKEITPSSELFQKIFSRDGTDTEVDIRRAQLSEQDVSASTILEDQKTRLALIEISKAGFARERDILSRRGKEQDEVKDILTRLKDTGLVSVEYLVECRKTSAPLARLPSRECLEASSFKDLRCATCNRSYSEERLDEVYTLSTLGRELTEKSHWMTIAVTHRLVEAGIPLDLIAWNVVEAGEEVDLVVDVLGDLWLFELKDREFGAGDAVAFNYRQVRYRASKAVVVTTDKVSSDARRVLRELSKAARGKTLNPIYVEGIENTNNVLKEEIESAYIAQARRKLVDVSVVSGYDLIPLVNFYMENIFGGQDQIEDDMSYITMRFSRELMRRRIYR